MILPRKAPDTSGFPIHLAWQDVTGHVRRCKARCVEVLGLGLAVETAEALPRRGLVDVQTESYSRLGFATVRSCERFGMKYSAELEFNSTMVVRDDKGPAMSEGIRVRRV